MLYIITCKLYNGIYPGDSKLFSSIKHIALDWRDQDTLEKLSGLTSKDVVIIRTLADDSYFPEEFCQFLEKLSKLPVRCWNNPNMIRWSTHKDEYLQSLHEKGIPIIPTYVYNPAENIDQALQTCKDKWNTESLVIKPSIGCSGKEVLFMHKNTKYDIPVKKMLIQPFISDILERGETSIIYYVESFTPNDKSGCVYGFYGIKKNVVNNVSTVHSGHYYLMSFIPKKTLKLARKILDYVIDRWGPPLFLRLDFIDNQLSELETIPVLYLDKAPVIAIKNMKKILEEFITI